MLHRLGLKEDIQDISFNGNTMIRPDRDEVASYKSVVGGLCIFVDNTWASHFQIHKHVLQITTSYLCLLDLSIYLGNLDRLLSF